MIFYHHLSSNFWNQNRKYEWNYFFCDMIEGIMPNMKLLLSYRETTSWDCFNIILLQKYILTIQTEKHKSRHWNAEALFRKNIIVQFVSSSMMKSHVSVCAELYIRHLEETFIHFLVAISEIGIEHWCGIYMWNDRRYHVEIKINLLGFI